jgi:hypothetical protein
VSEIKVRDIPGFPGRYYLDNENNVWSHWPPRAKMNLEPWMLLKGQGGIYTLVTGQGGDGKLTSEKFATRNSSVRSKRAAVRARTFGLRRTVSATSYWRPRWTCCWPASPRWRPSAGRACAPLNPLPVTPRGARQHRLVGRVVPGTHPGGDVRAPDTTCDPSGGPGPGRRPPTRGGWTAEP